MLIGGDDISNDVITLRTCFSMFVYIRARSAPRWLAEILQLSRRGVTGELEVDFNFQRHSCKRSFLFPPRRQSAPERACSPIAGYDGKGIKVSFGF